MEVAVLLINVVSGDIVKMVLCLEVRNYGGDSGVGGGSEAVLCR